MIKVCHMTSAHKSNDTRIFYKQCVSLAKAGYDVYLVAQGESFELNGVKIVGVPKIIGGRLKRMTQGAKSIYKKALEIDADIYQIHDPELLPYALKLKKKNKKVIFDSHEIYSMQIKQKLYLPKFSRNFIADTYYRYETQVCKKLDAIIVPSTVNGKNIFKNKVKKVIIIDNTPILNELYTKYIPDSKKKDRTICYIGGLTHERGITHLIKASYIANAELVLSGNFNPKTYFDALKALNEYTCVNYKVYVNRNGIVEILSECYIGICTLLNKGQYHNGDNLATKVYEYMSMGLPVIISDYPYARKVNDEYNCFVLVSPDNIDQIVNAINYLLDNPAIAKQMGQNGRRAVLEKFNWDVEEKKLINLYEDLV